MTFDTVGEGQFRIRRLTCFQDNYRGRIGGYLLMNKITEADVIHIRGTGGQEDFLWLSEKAEQRLLWVFTGLMIIAVSPVFALALLM